MLPRFHEAWANLSPVRHRMKNITPVDHRSFGFRKLSDLFAAIGLFEVKMEKTGTEFVRLKKGTVKKPAGKGPSKQHAEKSDLP